MEELLNYSDLQHIVAVKFCFFLFILFSVVAIYGRWKAKYFVFFIGIFSALAYYFLVHGTSLMFWGLKADEITISAMYEMFAHGSMASDFAYAKLPPFYPPLFFWMFGLIGRIMDWNGIQIAKFASFVTFALFPLIFYTIQKKYWTIRGSISKGTPGKLSWIISSALIFVFIRPDAIIIKPYELVSAGFAILWMQFLLNDLWNSSLDKRKIILFGFTGGVIFQLFYFWFFLIAISIALFNLFFDKVKLKQYIDLAIIGIIILIVGIPFWLPVAISYIANGAENWQLGFFVLDWIATKAPILQLSLANILMLVGICCLIFFRKIFAIRVLLTSFVSAYIWQMMGMFAILFFASPLQESKGFYFWNGVVLALASAYALERIWIWYDKKYYFSGVKKSIQIIGILLLSTLLIFGTFVDDTEVQNVRHRAKKMRPGVEELVNFLDHNYSVYDEVILSSGIPQLHAFLAVSDFVYFNQHNSHPAANFSERKLFLLDLKDSQDGMEFLINVSSSFFGQIDLFVFYKGVEGSYPIYFNVDDFPHKMKEEQILFSKHIFVMPYFNKVYENNHYIVFEPNKL